MQGAMLAVASGRRFSWEALHEAIQRRTDGAIARYYTRSEWEHLVSDLFVVKDIRVYGKKTEIVPIPAGKLKKCLRRIDTEHVQPISHQHLPLGIVSGLQIKQARERLICFKIRRAVGRN